MFPYFKDAVDFIKNIKKEDSVIIIFNNDADGISACALIDTVLKGKGVKPYIITQPMPTEKDLIRKIQTGLPTKLIFLDLAMDQQKSVITKLKGVSDILIVDHHSVHEDLNIDGVVHYNPRFKEAEIYQSATYLAYKITSEIQDMKKYLWIAATGMIGDYNLEYSQDVVEEVMEMYGIKNKNLYESPLGRLADMISASRATNEISCEDIVRVFEEAEKYENFSGTPGSEKMIKSFETIEKEMKRVEEDLEKNAEILGNLVLYELNSEYNLCSPLSTKVSKRYKKKVLVVYQKGTGKVHVSGRNQDKSFDVANIFKTSVSGLKGAGGGHPAAAGATVAVEDWDTFKKRLIRNLKN